MKELLEKIREEYVIYVSLYKVGDTYKVKKDGYFGLCYISSLIGRYSAFQEYLEKYKKTRKVYYNHYGGKTIDRSQFLWHPSKYPISFELVR